MSESKQAILEANEGQEVTVVLGDGGGASVFSGVLQKNSNGDAEYWEVLSPRGIVAQAGTPVPVPESLVCFSSGQFGHLIRKLETPEEALAKIQEAKENEGRRSSGLVSPNGGLLQ